ncbi:MAG: hypothetical protein ACOY3Y_10795 [Acidobacteriota bacterium]
MTDNETSVDSVETPPAGQPDGAAGDSGAGTDASADAGAAETEPEAEGDETVEDDPLTAAVQALDRLTEAVAQVRSFGGEEAEARLADLASELREAAEQIAPGTDSGDGQSADGFDGGQAGTDGASSAQPPAAPEPSGTPPSAAPAAAPSPAPAAASAPADPSAGVRETLTSLADALRALTETVRQQQQRLARVEKHSGLPHSVAPEGARQPADDEDVGWPMDLNRPFDRASVDKAVSFHDL